MDERTKKKHLRALRFGLAFLEGHRAEAVKQKLAAQDVVNAMQVALSALGFEAVAAEGYYNGVKSGSEKVTAFYRRKVDDLNRRLGEASKKTATVHVFPEEGSGSDNINCNFEPQLPGGFDFPNIGRGCPKESLA